ncbi:MAG: winged helix-turn-helix transcriptional regulator [Thermoplasmata archaeon]
MSPARNRRLPAGHPSREPCLNEGRELCPVVSAIGVIGTEWRLIMVHRLLDGPQRFSELLRTNAHLNAKTLSSTLKFLEAAGVVERRVLSTRPFVVVYSLTEVGQGLAPAIRELRLWGEQYLLPRVASARGSAATGTDLASPSALPLPTVAVPRAH